MKIQISERELLIVWYVLGGAPAWGGGEAELQVQAELWTEVQKRFGGPARKLDDLSTQPDDIELTDGAVKVLLGILVSPGQKVDTGPYSAAAVIRIRTAQQK